MAILIDSKSDLQNAELLDSAIIYDRDFDYDYFGFKVGTSRRSLSQSSWLVLYAVMLACKDLESSIQVFGGKA